MHKEIAWQILNGPAHEIMALFVLCKLILQPRMHSHPMGLDVWFSVGPFVYFNTSCVRTAKALVRLRWCAGSPEPSLVAYVISTIISWAAQMMLYIMWYSCQEYNLLYVFVLQRIENNWRTGRHTLQRIHCRSETSKGVYCLQYDDTRIVSGLRDNTIKVFEPPHVKTNKMACALSKDSDQIGHPPSLIRVFAVGMKKAWVLSYTLSTQRRLWSDSADPSLCWAHMPFYWFCHEATHLLARLNKVHRELLC